MGGLSFVAFPVASVPPQLFFCVYDFIFSARYQYWSVPFFSEALTRTKKKVPTRFSQQRKKCLGHRNQPDDTHLKLFAYFLNWSQFNRTFNNQTGTIHQPNESSASYSPRDGFRRLGNGDWISHIEQNGHDPCGEISRWSLSPSAVFRTEAQT
jgi:hypothetical protein